MYRINYHHLFLFYTIAQEGGIAKAGKKVEGIWAIDNDRALAAKFREMAENMTCVTQAWS